MTTSIPTPRGCVTCGASNPADARFCAQCGATMPPLPTAPPPPGSTRALLQDAREHLTLGRWEEASLAAEAVLTLDPDIAEAHFIAARAMLKQGMRGNAVRHAERAVELEPDNPQFQAALAAALDDQQHTVVRMPPPAIMASIVAAVVLLGIITLALANRGRERVALNPTAPTAAPAGPASPFSTQTGQNFPQPHRTAGAQYNRPRVPSPSAVAVAPETATGTTGTRATGAPGTVGATGTIGALTPGGATTPSNLAPAPVDATALQQFPAPNAPATASTPAPATTRTLPPRIPTRSSQAAPVTTAPPAFTVAPVQPNTSGSLFGPATNPANPAGTGFTPPAANGTGNTENAEAPAAPAPRPAAVSPQQEYVNRNYSGAIQGYLHRINNGEATGANYQQLALAYERVGDHQDAAAAYRSAVAAYQAQIQAGQDADLASRGLRSAQMALRRLQGR